MFFVDFSGGVLIDFHGFQINNLQLTKTRCKSTGFRILIRISDAQGLSFAAEDRKSYWSGCIQAAIVICQQIFAILALAIFLLKSV